MTPNRKEITERRKKKRWGDFAAHYDGPRAEQFHDLYDSLYDALSEEIYLDLANDFFEDVDRIVDERIKALFTCDGLKLLGLEAIPNEIKISVAVQRIAEEKPSEIV